MSLTERRFDGAKDEAGCHQPAVAARKGGGDRDDRPCEHDGAHVDAGLHAGQEHVGRHADKYVANKKDRFWQISGAPLACGVNGLVSEAVRADLITRSEERSGGQG